MSRGIKILVLGIGQSNFLDQLYGGVAQRSAQFSFDIDRYQHISTDFSREKALHYNQHFNFGSLKIAKLKLFATLLAFACTRFFWQIAFFEWSQLTGFRQVITQLKKYARAKYIAEKFIKGQYDIIHFHFCAPDNLAFLHFLAGNDKAICSFWGSDLMRLTGVSNVFYVSKALANATAVTVQTEELAEMLYCKYGRDLKNKVRTLRFTLEPDIYEAIDSLRLGNGLSDFKTRYNIPFDATVISVGHNAFPENNHFAILKKMEVLTPEMLSKLTFVLHLSYGGNDIYIQSLVDYAASNKLLNIIIIRDYLHPQEMAKLRCVTDILVQMPISDALSAAMTEVLYAGNCVLAGAWLPYGILRRNGLQYAEITDFDVLDEKITAVINNLESEKQQNVGNAARIKSFLFPDTTSKDWITLFNNVGHA